MNGKKKFREHYTVQWDKQRDQNTYEFVFKFIKAIKNGNQGRNSALRELKSQKLESVSSPTAQAQEVKQVSEQSILENLKVRLYDLDIEKEYAIKIRDILSERIMNKMVNLKVIKTDKYGRYLAEVLYKKENINDWKYCGIVSLFYPFVCFLKYI